MPAGHVLFDSVWKRFHRGPSHDSLRDLIPALFRRNAGTTEGVMREGDFWAVRDVSFEVKPGETLGIIGGNGAGKSTTLKLLTKILTPTRGHAAVRGRAGALIEVSAGFHGDLTGRENVFLQGAIMGMPQRLIREKFDEIVEFSGVEAFIDTPVKRYSSGMGALLGFSIAVHLEPEALIIDEVLSVGDVSFQNRAFDRIKALARSDIPVVIVSHQLDRIVELCTSCILLRSGAVAYHGDPRQAVEKYLSGEAPPGGAVARGAIALETLEPEWEGVVASGTTLRFRIKGRTLVPNPPDEFKLEFAIRRIGDAKRLYGTDLDRLHLQLPMQAPFDWHLEFEANLNTGLYQLESFVWDSNQGRIVADGPRTVLQIEAAPEFIGEVQTQMRIVGR